MSNQTARSEKSPRQSGEFFLRVVACGLLFAFLSLSAWAGSTPPAIDSGKSTVAPQVDSLKQAEAPPSKPEAASPSPAESKPVAAGSPVLRFVAYNVENWLTLEKRYLYDEHRELTNAPKPEKEKAAVVQVIKEANPDVLGLCEIGTREDLLDIQQRLKQAGIDLPHLAYTGGMDPVRHLGFLSKLPLQQVTLPKEAMSYRLGQKEFLIQRGVMDVTVQTPDQRKWHFIGVHFKSKRETDDGDQAAMRLREAQLLRRHLDTVLQQDPQAALIVYGDFNDAVKTPALRAVEGPANSPRALMRLWLRDSRGERWTHYWGKEESYAPLDHIFVSHALWKQRGVVMEQSRIIDIPAWENASDHRALLAVFR